MARDDFATFEYIMFISVFNVKTKVTVYIYLKYHYKSTKHNSIRERQSEVILYFVQIPNYNLKFQSISVKNVI